MSRGRRELFNYGNESLSITELLNRPEVSNFVTRGMYMSHTSQRERIRRILHLGGVTPETVNAYNRQNPLAQRQQAPDNLYGAQRPRAGLPKKDTRRRVIQGPQKPVPLPRRRRPEPTPRQHRCNLSAHARVLSLIEGKWRILKELCSFGFQEDQQCFCYSDC